MIIDTSEIASSPRAVALTYARPPMDGTVGAGEDVELRATAERVDSGIRLSGHLETQVSLPCARCTKVFTIPVAIDFSLVYRSRPSHRTVPAETVLTSEECREVELDGPDRIDLLELTREQVYLAVPLKPLCASSCRGLCNRCGGDLNVRPCQCSVQVRDPRWDALADLNVQHSTTH